MYKTTGKKRKRKYKLYIVTETKSLMNKLSDLTQETTKSYTCIQCKLKYTFVNLLVPFFLHITSTNL